MTRHLNSALPFDSWPAEDRQAWSACFKGDGDIFDDRPGVALAPSTVSGRKAAYGMWLGFLNHLYPETLVLSPADRVNPDRIKDYVGYLRENCRQTTISHHLIRLFYVLRHMCPDSDWDWLYRIGRRMAWQAEPIKQPRIVSLDLYALGLRLMDRAVAKGKRASRITKSAAIMYRDGLLIATLVEAPMRRRAFSMLRIDEHVLKMGHIWVLVVPPELSKTKVAQEYQLSERLSKAMDLYLERYRLAFPGADRHDYLWTYIGRPMTDKMVRRRTIKWTQGALGVPVSPHRFRNAAANFIVIVDPENIRVAKDLLAHKSFDMTEKHYIDAAQSRIAGRELARLLQQDQEVHHATAS